MAFLLVMKIVEKVIYPIITKPESIAEFSLNAIARQRNHYGIVTNINSDSYRPITINWDKNEPFAYTEDEIRVLKIKIVEQLLPQETIVSMPPGTTVLLENGEQIKFDYRQKFLVENNSDRLIIIQNIDTKETYQFQLDYFPGQVFVHFIEPATVTPLENLPLTQHELKYKAEIWLLLEFNCLLLNNLTPTIEQQQKQKWLQNLDRPFNPDELDAAWQISFSQFLQTQAEKVGLYGLKISTKILKQTVDNQFVFGHISDIDFYQSSFLLQWDDGEKISLSYLEMKALAISLVSLVKLSDRVAYEISSERELLKAYIGFRTKKLAQAWLKLLKQIVGRLSNLKDCRREEKRHFLEKRWQYSVEKFRHKKISRRLQDLEIIARLDLEKPP
ncbi:hypothetical protein Sta7437_4549 (plasmid) [Stanieria cyanosphaera PCC 7437]|uniref:Uncharacterized protein n=1 Tax=Stanieria cyanosphaera (strain ATCC 29371 / PCC 7437) TaxID=111780 RepID=K9XZI6_STAC7|nr:hypothetical protein [Stanieria cyanosphaera]AFZ38010.1 hypothetical protein Sta7437_4549 [Stanieria cyanosphaera PCC 7437]